MTQIKEQGKNFWEHSKTEDNTPKLPRNYAVTITELHYGDKPDTITVYTDYLNTSEWAMDNLENALQVARMLQRQNPDGYEYSVIELGTIYTV